jgi:hypothetical protein
MESLITAYLFDAMGVHAGTLQIDPTERVPENSTFEPPPLLDRTQHARWNGSSWLVLDDIPVPGMDVVDTAPLEVTRRRALQALFIKYGLKESDIEDAIVLNITDPNAQYLALTEFRAAQTFERGRELVVTMGVALKLDLPALFIFAAELP